MKRYCLILSLATLLILASSTKPLPRLNPIENFPEILKISKQLCVGCNAEALEFLVNINIVRAKKSELPLSWDPKLEEFAKGWAAKRYKDCKMEHSFPEGKFDEMGETIFWGSGSDWKPKDAIDDWADEEKYYNYGLNTCAEGQSCGHYTQIVSNVTKTVGCAKVVCKDGDMLISCNYKPPGNAFGERPY